MKISVRKTLKVAFLLALFIPFLFFPGCVTTGGKSKAEFKRITNTTNNTSVFIPVDWDNFFAAPFVFDQTIQMSQYTAVAGFIDSSKQERDVYVIGYMVIVQSEKTIIYALYRNEQFYAIREPEGFPEKITEAEFKIFNAEMAQKSELLNSSY